MADALSDAKKALGHAEKAFPTSMAKAAGVNPPAAPKPAMPAPKPIAVGNPEGNIGKEIADKVQNVEQVKPTLPKMHKGGKVEETGPVILKEDETVRTKQQEKAVDDKLKGTKAKDLMTKDEPKPKAGAPKGGAKPKAKHKHTHIEHHYDEAGQAKGHTVRHVPVGGGEETSYAAPDLQGVHNGLEEHLGEPAPAPVAPPTAPPAAGGPPAVAPPQAPPGV